MPSKKSSKRFPPIKCGLYDILMPTVWRDNVLNGLRLATRDGNFYTYVKMMDRAHAYSESINWLDSIDAREKIERDCADHISDEGLASFNRALSSLDRSILPVV